MPDLGSLDSTSITSLMDVARSQASPGSFEQMLASGVTQTSLDPSGMQDLAKQLSSSGGSSLTDPVYIAVAGVLSLFGTGLLIYGKKTGELKPMLRGLALMVLSYDYKSPIVWGIAIAIGVLALMVE